MSKYLVTGACGGMGTALCRALAGKGHEVWGIDRKTPDEPQAWHSISADVTDTEQLGAAFERVKLEAGGLDGIINMAGIYDLGSLVEMSEEDFVRDFNVNLFGMFRVNRLFLPLLAPKSRIVIISSELAPLDPLPFTGIYAITKAAVEKYAFSLRMELQLLGHKVIVVRPGAVKTDLLPGSVKSLERFVDSTELYKVNAARFRKIVNSVETKSITPDRLARRVMKTLKARRPRLVYNINRNPLLLLLNALPDRLQLAIIKGILS